MAKRVLNILASIVVAAAASIQSLPAHAAFFNQPPVAYGWYNPSIAGWEVDVFVTNGNRTFLNTHTGGYPGSWTGWFNPGYATPGNLASNIAHAYPNSSFPQQSYLSITSTVPGTLQCEYNGGTWQSSQAPYVFAIGGQAGTPWFASNETNTHLLGAVTTDQRVFLVSPNSISNSWPACPVVQVGWSDLGCCTTSSGATVQEDSWAPGGQCWTGVVDVFRGGNDGFIYGNRSDRCGNWEGQRQVPNQGDTTQGVSATVLRNAAGSPSQTNVFYRSTSTGELRLIESYDGGYGWAGPYSWGTTPGGPLQAAPGCAIYDQNSLAYAPYPFIECFAIGSDGGVYWRGENGYARTLYPWVSLGTVF